MSFMQAQVTDKQYWIEVEGPQGIEYIPADLVDNPKSVCDAHKSETRQSDPPGAWVSIEWPDGEFPIPATIRDYVQQSTYWNIALVHAYGVRLSAPGYLDCTDWEVYSSKREAQQAARALESEDD
jgi:hypothetical protein